MYIIKKERGKLEDQGVEDWWSSKLRTF